MHRIDTPTAQVDKFGAGKNGFTNGDPSTGRRATDLNSDMWDAVQEEICNVIEQSGIALNKTQHDQLYVAITSLIANAVPDALLRKNNLSDIVSKEMARSNLGLGTLSTQNANSVSITGGSARLDTLDVSNTASFSGTVTYKGLDYLIKNSFVNAPADNSNSTFGLRLVGQGGQRSDELFYEKIGQYAARRFVVISGGGGVTFDMRQDGSFVSLNAAGNYQIYPDGNISGPRWGGYLFDYISNLNAAIRKWAGETFASIDYVNQTFMRDSRFGSPTTIFKSNGTNVFTCPSGYTFSSMDTGDVGSVTATARPVQKLINNTWITVSQL